MWSTVALGLIVTVGLTCGGCGWGADNDAVPHVYDFIKAFPKAKTQAPDPRYVTQPASNYAEVAGDRRPVLSMHPPSSAEFPSVRITAESIFTFGFCILEAAWGKPGDGVEFTVLVRLPDNAQERLFSQYIDPKHNPEDRRWFTERISLERFAAAKRIQITLATSPGPAGDNNFDWAVWSEPQIVLSRTK
jgi:hypothetical protein